MLHSMTGFARQSAETPFGTLSWELRAVNHRYLEVQFRLPDELRPNEHVFKQQLSAALKRGKIDCALHFQRAGSRQDDMLLNTELVKLIGRRAAEVAANLPAAAALNPLEVMRWPGVMQDAEVDVEPLLAAATQLLATTLAALAAMRASEGERIQAMIVSRCNDIAALAAAVRERMPEIMAAVRDKQRERIARLDVSADPARLELELALVAQKLDVDEEVDRLDSHLTEIRDALDSGEPVGRRLDFLMQELNREANTLGSKSADAQTTKAAVELKVLIEQMREQIQNIE
jgi:uncharacterized protein (TIGR00255 family)